MVRPSAALDPDLRKEVGPLKLEAAGGLTFVCVRFFKVFRLSQFAGGLVALDCSIGGRCMSFCSARTSADYKPLRRCSHDCPWVNEVDLAAHKIGDTSGCQPGPSDWRNRRDLRIRAWAHRSAECALLYGDFGNSSRRVAAETEDTAAQILCEHAFRRSHQRITPA